MVSVDGRADEELLYELDNTVNLLHLSLERSFVTARSTRCQPHLACMIIVTSCTSQAWWSTTFSSHNHICNKFDVKTSKTSRALQPVVRVTTHVVRLPTGGLQSIGSRSSLMGHRVL